jgi:hypothetical protein
MAMGSTTNGCIKLWANDNVELGLVVGEGTETVLAASQIIQRGTLLQPAWAMTNAGYPRECATRLHKL